MSMRVDVVFNHFPHLAADLDSRVDRFARAVAFDVQARAIVNTTRVDTGAMKNGWRVQWIAEGVYMVYNEQFYAIYHEFGTYKMPAAPMLDPALAETASDSNLALLAAGFWEV